MIKRLLDILPFLRSAKEWYDKRRELPVSRKKSEQIRLAKYLEAQGEVLTLSPVDLVAHNLRHEGYRKIKWRDPKTGKKWNLVNAPNGTFPLSYPFHNIDREKVR